MNNITSSFSKQSYPQQSSYQYQSNKTYNNHMTTQKMTQQEEQIQDQALIQYYIYEDFKNLINLIYSLQIIYEHFNNDKNNEILIISRNKIISQLNISNLLHCDIQKNYNYPKYQQLIYKEKWNVKQLIAQLPEHIRNSPFLYSYQKNSLSDKVVQSQQQLEKTNIASNFNQDVLCKVFSSMQFIDKEVDQIKSQNYYSIPTIYNVLSEAEQYQILTQNKLKASFPQKQEFQQQVYRNEQNPLQSVQTKFTTQPQQYGKSSNQYHQQDQNNNYIKGYKNLGSH